MCYNEYNEREVDKMTITKKHIDTWFGCYVLMTDDTTKSELRVSFIYDNNGMYVIHIRLANKPQNKYFNIGNTLVGLMKTKTNIQVLKKC